MRDLLARVAAISLTGKVALLLVLFVSFWVFRTVGQEEPKKKKKASASASTVTVGESEESSGPSDPWEDFVENDETAKKKTFSKVDTSSPLNSYRKSVDGDDYDEPDPKATLSANYRRRPTAMVRSQPVDEYVVKRRSQLGRQTLPIAKYLWDDPGDDKGIAFIRFDCLPILDDPKTTIPWTDVEGEGTTATVELEGEGLVLKVKTDSAKSAVDYGLKIAKLYGQVDQVTVETERRLVLRLQKKMEEKENLKAWPLPHKKAVSFLV